MKKVIVIDNNSVDSTSKIAGQTGAKVIKEKKQGYGFAIIRGLKEGDQVAITNIEQLTSGTPVQITEIQVREI